MNENPLDSSSQENLKINKSSMKETLLPNPSNQKLKSETITNLTIDNSSINSNIDEFDEEDDEYEEWNAKCCCTKCWFYLCCCCCCFSIKSKNKNTFKKGWKKFLAQEEGKKESDDTFRSLTNLYAGNDDALEAMQNIRLNPNLVSESKLRNDIEFYIPQLCTYLLFGDFKAIEEFFVFLCKVCNASFFFAHRVHWFLSAMINASQEKKKDIIKILKMINTIFKSESDKHKNKLHKFYLANSDFYIKYLKNNNLYFLYDNKIVSKNKDIFEEKNKKNLASNQENEFNKYKNSRDIISHYSTNEYITAKTKEESKQKITYTPSNEQVAEEIKNFVADNSYINKKFSPTEFFIDISNFKLEKEDLTLEDNSEDEEEIDLYDNKNYLKSEVILKKNNPLSSEKVDLKLDNTKHKSDTYVDIKNTVPDINFISYCSSINFIDHLSDVSNDLPKYPINQQMLFLYDKLLEINKKLPCNVYLPFLKDSCRNYFIVHIPLEGARIFRTKTRCPIMLTFEMIRIDEVVKKLEEEEENMSFCRNRSHSITMIDEHDIYSGSFRGGGKSSKKKLELLKNKIKSKDSKVAFINADFDLSKPVILNKAKMKKRLSFDESTTKLYNEDEDEEKDSLQNQNAGKFLSNKKLPLNLNIKIEEDVNNKVSGKDDKNGNEMKIIYKESKDDGLTTESSEEPSESINLEDDSKIYSNIIKKFRETDIYSQNFGLRQPFSKTIFDQNTINSNNQSNKYSSGNNVVGLANKLIQKNQEMKEGEENNGALDINNNNNNFGNSNSLPNKNLLFNQDFIIGNKIGSNDNEINTTDINTSTKPFNEMPENTNNDINTNINININIENSKKLIDEGHELNVSFNEESTDEIKPTDLTLSANTFKDIFGESFKTKEKNIKQSSLFGKFKTHKIFRCIIKTHEDLRQEQFATQLINEFYQIFQLEKVGCWLNTYEIISTGNDAGLVEMVNDSLSLDQLKQKTHNTSLKDFYIYYFGQGDSKSKSYIKAMNNFVSSLAGYSLVCYFLQIKDRHNGNILVDNEGHLIHIDFGFLLSNAPGKGIKFEKAPFKLSKDMITCLGGENSVYFKKFRKLLHKGFIAVNKHYKKILILVEMMWCGHGKQLECFEKGQESINSLKQRLNPKENMGKFDAIKHVDSLIKDSFDNWRTKWYDIFQYYMQGIFY